MKTKTDSDSQPVKVIFRKWRDKRGDILALFPEVAHDYQGYKCSSFALHEGHGGADGAGCVRRTKPATPEEYAATKRALENGYGYVLRVVSRIPRNALETRRAEIAAQDARHAEKVAALEARNATNPALNALRHHCSKGEPITEKRA